MASARFNEICAEIEATREKLQVTQDPIQKRKLLLALRVVIADLDHLAAATIKDLPGK